ncbi:TusA-related sulfurtransferase [Tumebacillus sp. BK434]|uniref:sulfurtransferase TusA family protein n=1 Tax=Tumebacillus sp. BK434 TaxID=2512169 RepID=UPI0010504807|nr:sulfurtransferase TusA family protein [Tumebacillus sp. BK434]TCP52677.1 TusA-related sulfurtransferase [Tumebacillus sp. BK434]
MSEVAVDKTIDCKGLSCPMPIVRTKKAIDALTPGEVLEVVATDAGSVADIKSWADRTGHQYIGTATEDGLYKHYIRKSKLEETQPETQHQHRVSNADLQAKLSDHPVILDVREPAEYSFGHIPGAKLVPFGQLEAKLDELEPLREQEIYVICRSGSRSDLACQWLTEKGFPNVKNVLPGMSGWTGPVQTR